MMKSYSLRKLTIAAVLGLGVVYVSQTWSPSCYAIVLQRVLHAKNDGLVARTPRWVRGDEWGVATPLTQAAVNNHFRRYNETSLYREDLRINYGMPILDWGLVFKPTMCTGTPLRF
jgi:hypothetical protein